MDMFSPCLEEAQPRSNQWSEGIIGGVFETAWPPRMESVRGISVRNVTGSLSRKAANGITNAGVAEVTNAPLEAVDRFVSTNWNPNEMPYPTNPITKIFLRWMEDNLGSRAIEVSHPK